MLRNRCAVLFDLDDTLYPQRRFVLSAFAAMAQHLSARFDVPARDVFRRLSRAYRGPQRGREIQLCLALYGWPESLTTALVDVSRSHRPSLRLPPASRAALAALRPDWRLAVVTNGTPRVQAAKIAALGLRPLVDAVVFAGECGSGRGKPDREPFDAALTQLGVGPHRAVFVGDNEECDIRGAAALGMRTVRVSRQPGVAGHSAADAVVRSMREVPDAVAGLVSRREGSRDVA